MIRPPVDEFDDAYEPTWVARQSIKFAKPWTKKRLAKKARELMVDDLREREELRVQEENEDHMQKFEDDCRKRRNEEIGGYGKPRSRWERLWDADEGKPYWHQWETRESVWDKPCICHVCDANIPVRGGVEIIRESVFIIPRHLHEDVPRFSPSESGLKLGHDRREIHFHAGGRHDVLQM